MDPKEQERWCGAVLLGGLPFMWRKAEVARNLIYDRLELRKGDKVLIIGECIESCGFVDDMRVRIGPGGEIKVFDITDEARDNYIAKKRGRGGQLATWAWTYTRDIQDGNFDCAVCLQGVQHADDWRETGAELAALDKPYVNVDGDLVADTPAKTVDPATLVFAYTPGEDRALHASVWDGLLRHLEKLTDKHVKFFPVQSNAAELEAMRAGRLHIAAFGTGSVPIAVNCAGFVPFAVMGGERGILGYEMEIITYLGSGINTPADIRGRKLAFTSPTSNSGFKEPSVLLRKEFGLEAGRDYTSVFSGRHESSILGVANKDYDAAAIANEVMRRMIARGVVNEQQIRSIYKSATFPTAAFGLAYNLEPSLAAKVREAFFSFPWAGTALEQEFSTLGVSKFLPTTYKQSWALVRDVDAAMNVQYTCK